MEIIAHRGFHLKPSEENTIMAFLGATTLGCPMLELDVRLTKDLFLVVCHDDKFEFKGNIVRIKDHRLEDMVKSGLVIDRMTEVDPLRPPTLKLVLRFFLSRIKINVDLKEQGSGLAFTKLLGKMRDKKLLPPDFESRVIVFSFLQDEVAKVKQLFPKIEAALSIRGFRFSFLRKKQLLGWLRRNHIQTVYLDEESVADRKVILFFQDHGLGVRVYVVNDPKLLADYERFGVKGVFTDKPKELLNFDQKLWLNRHCEFCGVHST